MFFLKTFHKHLLIAHNQRGVIQSAIFPITPIPPSDKIWTPHGAWGETLDLWKQYRNKIGCLGNVAYMYNKAWQYSCLCALMNCVCDLKGSCNYFSHQIFVNMIDCNLSDAYPTQCHVWPEAKMFKFKAWVQLFRHLMIWEFLPS